MKNNVNRTKLQLYVKTALMLGLLIVAQYITKSMGQIVTGSCVNALLASSAFILGFVPALALALISPFMAFVFGIGTPILAIVPVIALGNSVYVAIIALGKKKLNEALVVVMASIVKFICLFISITKVVLPLLNLPEAKIAALSAAFSYPQLITALIGGFLSLALAKAIAKSR